MSEAPSRRLAILGPTVISGTVVTGIEGALLAMLALNLDQTVGRVSLSQALWPRATEGQARSRLKTYVWRVRRSGYLDALDATLATERDGYALHLDPALLDVHVFRRLLDEADEAMSTGGWEVSRSKLDEALQLWRGRPLPDVDNPAYWLPQVGELEEDREKALDLRIEADLRLGHGREAVATLHELARAQPNRVRRWQLLIEALQTSGRSVEALAVAREARRRLHEAGLTESVDLIDDLEGAVLRHERPGGVPMLRRRRVTGTRQSDLVGRDEELALLEAAWDRSQRGSTRAASLAGPPGCGATHLATTFAAQLLVPVVVVEPGARPPETPRHPVIVLVEGPGRGGPTYDHEVLDLIARLPQGSLVLIMATSPRRAASTLLARVESELGEIAAVRVQPMEGPVLAAFLDTLDLEPAPREHVAQVGAGLPGLVIDLADGSAPATSRVDARLLRWVDDLDERDREGLARLVVRGTVHVPTAVTGPEALQQADLLDRAIAANLLTQRRDDPPGTWQLATPLLVPHLTGTRPASLTGRHDTGDTSDATGIVDQHL